MKEVLATAETLEAQAKVDATAKVKGAMVMEITPKSRYPVDPQGQALAAGVNVDGS